MTHSNSREYWAQRQSDAEKARIIAETKLATVQRTGQLALFVTQRPRILAERRGEVTGEANHG